MSSKKVLFCVLNWGIGHATRSIPVIRKLINRGHTIALASDGAARAVLQNEFPDLQIHSLPGYNIRYSRSLFWLQMAVNGCKIQQGVKTEQKAISQLVKQFQPDVIISDNRYGCFSKSVPSYIITHQLQLLLPPYIRPFAPVINKRLQRLLAPFTKIWVPDLEPPNSLSGKLSQGAQQKTYIGWLSRFTKEEIAQELDILAVVSGPEPHRTAFEQMLLKQLQQSNLKSALVAGKPGAPASMQAGNITHYSYLNGTELNRLFNTSELVVCRSGYSSIMDLVALQKKAILVPTPNQSEQEYLAQHMQENNYFTIIREQELDLGSLLKTGEAISPPKRQDSSLLDDALSAANL